MQNKELDQRILQLQRENKALSESLYAVNEKLKDAEKLKGHFISNVANEIINPFASVLALAESIKKLNEHEIDQARHMAGLIFEEAFHLDFQLKNIFAAAAIEAGLVNLFYSQVNLKQLGDSVAGYFSHMLTQKQIQLFVRLNCGDPGKNMVVSDQEKLVLILKNLISNSIKYSPEGSEIGLEFRVNQAGFEIEISDCGKGIDPSDRKIVFDRFKQLDEKINSANTGHGLGLSIVQAYTELMGGQINLGANSAGGTRVLIVLPEVSPENTDDLDDFLLDSEAIY